MRFQTYRRAKGGALAALVLVPVAAAGVAFLPAHAQDGKIKEPGKVEATWSASTAGVTSMPYRTYWDASARGRNMPASYRGAVVIQRLSNSSWKSGMMLTPAGARDLAVQIVVHLHATSGSIQIWNHWYGKLNQTEMHFTPQSAYGLAYHLLLSSAGH
jgi:hypothetical protein